MTHPSMSGSRGHGRRSGWTGGAGRSLRLAAVLALAAAPAHGRLVAYYTSWSIYARDYLVTDIPAASLTHIHYAFANILDGRVVVGDTYADTDRFYPGDCWDPGCRRGNFHQLEVLKTVHPQLRTLISVGGWTWSAGFSAAAATQEARRVFARSCRDFLESWGFDGVDLDWEYPVWGGDGSTSHDPADGVNFVHLVAAVRASLDSLETQSGRECLLTIAVPASPLHIADLHLPAMLPHLDGLNIMSYDFHGPWGGEADAVTHFNSPLAPVTGDPLPEPYAGHFNVTAAITNYRAAGVPAGQLTLGLPFYGRGYANLAGGQDGLFASYGGPLAPGTWESGVFDYWDLAASYIHAPGVVRHRHGEAQVPWLHHPGQGWMISYDDSLSLVRKVELLRREGLAGAMVWELSGDREGVLLEAVAAALAAPPPGLPAPFVGIRRDGGDMVLEWGPVPGATAYRVERSHDGVTFQPMGQTVSTSWREPLASPRQVYRVVALAP
jgi:chitinase